MNTSKIYIGIRKSHISDDDTITESLKDFEGLEKYMYIRQWNGDVMESILITQSVLDHIHLTEVEAWEIAERNTFAETKIQSVGSMLESITEREDTEDEIPLFCVSNRIATLGAASILNRDAITKLGDDLGIFKFVVLPSSVHEMLLVPYTGCDIDVFSQVVQEMNENTDIVEPEERLTDKAYVLSV